MKPSKVQVNIPPKPGDENVVEKMLFEKVGVGDNVVSMFPQEQEECGAMIDIVSVEGAMQLDDPNLQCPANEIGLCSFVLSSLYDFYDDGI